MRVSLELRSLAEPTTVRLTAPTVVFTIEWALGSSGDTTLDRSNLLLTSRSAELAGDRLGLLTLHPPVLVAVEREYASLGLDRRMFERWLRHRTVLPRTTWLHEILHRFVFEHHALGHRDNLATRFLEIEIAKEIYFLFRDRERGADRASTLRTPGAPIERALRYIESHLFEDCDVRELARIAGASESTLLRQFQAEVGATPGAYWRNRKLDQALLALRSGRSVAEVAIHVGYDNPTSFGFAFTKRFGRSPSTFRPRGRVRAAP